MKAIKKIFLFLICFTAVACLALGVYVYAVTADAELQPEKLALTETCVTVFDGSGKELDTPREHASLSSLPSHLPEAFIAVEDKRYYSHHGLDYMRIGKAILKNIASFSFREGASTISQQLIKNTHLSSEKTLNRKLKEWKLVRQLEKRYSKEEIMELYLNSIYFGHNAFGVENAAQFYFGKHAKDVTPAESATLAALVKSPNRYSPFRDGEKCLSRRNFVLSLMEEQGFLSEQETQEAMAQPLPEAPTEAVKSSYLSLVFDELATLFPDAKSGETFRIYTYLDRDLQAELEQTSADTDVCLIVRDNADHGILAFHSTCGIIKRQPASTIKPLAVYAPAIEENLISPATPVLDEAVDYGGYSPSNSDRQFHGYVSVRQALARSINVPAVKTLNSLSPATAAKYLAKMELAIPQEDETLALALGGVKEGFTLPKLIDGYATFANGGVFSPSRTIARIEDERGKIVFENKPQETRVFSPDTAYLIDSMLQTAVREGTAKKLKSLPFEVCAKTGTSEGANGNVNAYTIAYTRDHTVGVWHGNRDNSPIQATGGGLPANHTLNILKRLSEHGAPPDFVMPDSVREVPLDKEEYEQNHQLVVADSVAPSYLSQNELFRESSMPRIVSSRFSRPTIQKPTISVINGAVCIELCQTQYYDYVIKRKNDSAETVIYSGKYRKQIYDNSVLSGVRYTYTVTPSFQNIMGESVTLPTVLIPNSNSIPDDWWEESTPTNPSNRSLRATASPLPTILPRQVSLLPLPQRKAWV